MRKKVIPTAIALVLGIPVAHSATMTSATFTMLTPTGGIAAQPDTAVTGSIGNGTWSVASPTIFYGFPWTAYSGTTFGPGTYTFDTIQGGVYTGVVVGKGQVGGHILFSWDVYTDIDVVEVWDVKCDSTQCNYTSTDATVGNPAGPDGVRGIPMIDGAYSGFTPNFDFTVPTPLPASAWLFGSGFIALLGLSRRKKIRNSG